jgi:predicted aspartyl protease
MIRTACTVAFAFSCLMTVARAEDCGPLKQINSIDLVKPNPSRALVPVSINGTPKLFLLDTGGDSSSISGDVADQLQLPTRDANGTMLDLYGHASTKYAVVEKFGVGRQMGDIHLMVMPDPDFGRGTRFVGIFAPDLMGRFDVEIDFGTYKMNYFSPDHCPGKVVYWPHNALAVLPFTFHKRHIRFTVKMDGKDVLAEFDSGAPNTTMTAEAARRLFDITPDSAGNVTLDGQGKTAVFQHTFDTLDFEGVAVKNAHVNILPDMVGSKDANNAQRTGNRARMTDDLDDHSDMLVGMDILRRLHLYIAFDESRIFLSEASTPAKPGAPPADNAVANTSAQQ